jgi:hypothetical protein
VIVSVTLFEGTLKVNRLSSILNFILLFYIWVVFCMLLCNCVNCVFCMLLCNCVFCMLLCNCVFCMLLCNCVNYVYCMLLCNCVNCVFFMYNDQLNAQVLNVSYSSVYGLVSAPWH